MHKLARQVRFSVNPFLPETSEGANSYASRPAGSGLAIYLGLWVELAGPIDADTGFVVNVVDIDKIARRAAIPVIAGSVKTNFANRQHVSLLQLCKLLGQSWQGLAGKFGEAKLCKLALELNPFRNISIKSEQAQMFYFSEKFEFAAMHTLWNEKFSDEKNFQVFGKCANPNGHGHNYIVEVTVEKSASDEELNIGDFEGIVNENFISKVDHKNLNADVAEFKTKNPTVENITVLAWEKLSGKFENAKLSKITVWETNRTCCSYCGP